MKISRILLLMMAVGFVAAQRTETVKIAKADTVVTIKVDTVKTVVWDTLVITRVLNDTSIILKTDTAKVPGVTRTSVPSKVVKQPAKK